MNATYNHNIVFFGVPVALNFNKLDHKLAYNASQDFAGILESSPDLSRWALLRQLQVLLRHDEVKYLKRRKKVADVAFYNLLRLSSSLSLFNNTVLSGLSTSPFVDVKSSISFPSSSNVLFRHCPLI